MTCVSMDVPLRHQNTTAPSCIQRDEGALKAYEYLSLSFHASSLNDAVPTTSEVLQASWISFTEA